MKNLKSLLFGAAIFTTTLPLAHAVLITVPGSPIGGGQLVGTTFTIATAAVAPEGTNAYPPNEPPNDAIDGTNGAKYLNFGELNTGYIVTPLVGLSNVTGLTLGTANDAPARDPATFSLYGSNTQVASGVAGTTFNLSNFTAIALNQNAGLDADPGRLTTIPDRTFANAANYTTYLLIFPTIRDVGGANSMQIGEAALQGTIVPEPASAALFGIGALGLAGFRRRRTA